MDWAFPHSKYRPSTGQAAARPAAGLSIGRCSRSSATAPPDSSYVWQNAEPTHDELLLEAGEAVWAAGPLSKGSNLCHGTGGNGYALLELYGRTGDPLWLERARAFAMHGIAQTRSDERAYRQLRYPL